MYLRMTLLSTELKFFKNLKMISYKHCHRFNLIPVNVINFAWSHPNLHIYK